MSIVRATVRGVVVVLLAAMVLIVQGRTQSRAIAAVRPDGIGYYNPADGTFHLRRDATKPGSSDFAYRFGPVGSYVQPLVGDWNGDGVDGIGYFNSQDGTVHLRNDATRAGPSDYAYLLTAAPGAKALVGDWNGDGRDGIGYLVPGHAETESVDLRDDATRNGPAQYSFSVTRRAAYSFSVFSGDWTGTGRDGWAMVEDPAPNPGFAPGDLYLDTDIRDGFQVEDDEGRSYYFQSYFAGDWNGDGRDGLGYFDSDHTVHLRNAALSVGSSSDYAYRFATGVNSPEVLCGRW